MGRLPTFRAGTAPPRETGLVRADPGALTDTGDAQFRAIAGAGRAIQSAGGMAADAAIKHKNLDNQAAAGRADARSVDALTEATDAINGMDFSQNTILPDDPKKYYSGETGDILEFTTEDKLKGREEQIAIVNGRLESLSKAMGFRGEKARLRWLEGKKNVARETLTKVSNAKQVEYQTELFLGNARNAAVNGDIEVSEQWIKLAEDSGLIGPKLAGAEKANNVKAYKKGLIDGTKPIIEGVLIENDFAMKPANEAVDASVAELQKEGILDEAEAAEARRELSNWAADVASQRKKQEHEDIIQTTMGFAEELAKGTFTGDDVALSNLTITQQKLWEPVVTGARKPPPTASEFSGSNVVVQTLTDYAIGKIGQLKAIGNIIEQRYQEDSITDDYYKFALNRIKNKYPNDVAKTLAGAIEAAKSSVHHRGTGIFGKDWIDSNEKAKLVEVQTGLLSWIDEESKGGNFPSGEAIYQKVRELGISVKTPTELQKKPPPPIPAKTDILYDPNDQDFNSLAPGTRWYDPVTKQWWEKN